MVIKPFSPSMNLKQFMVSRSVLSLYRNILRTIKQVPSKEDQNYLINWARSDFKMNKNITDELAIKSLMAHGENSLRELQRNLNRIK